MAMFGLRGLLSRPNANTLAFVRQPLRDTHKNKFVVLAVGLALGGAEFASAEAENEIPPAEIEIEAPKTEEPSKRASRRRRVRETKLPNPGKFEDMERDCREIQQLDTFKGARFGLSKALFPQQSKKQVVCNGNIWMGTEQLPEQHTSDFMTQVILDNHKLVARLDNGGRVTGRWICDALAPRVHSTVSFMAAPDKSQNYIMLDVDVKGEDWVAAMKAMSQGQASLNFVQSLTPELAIGAEVMHVFEQQTMLSVSARYKNMWDLNRKGEVYTLSFPYESAGGMVNLTYTRKLNENVSLASEFTLSPQTHQSKCQFGARFMRRSFIFQTAVDSEMTVMSTLDTGINDLVRMQLSGELKHYTNESNFGFGFSLGL